MSGIDVCYNRLPTETILVETSVGDPEILSAKVRIWRGMAQHAKAAYTTGGGGWRGWGWALVAIHQEVQGEKKGGSKKSVCWVSVSALGAKDLLVRFPTL
jgi:hypothetical protein